LLVSCANQAPVSVDEDDYIADESSVGAEYMATDILNRGETFTPNKIYFVNEKIKVSRLKTTKDSPNLEKQEKYRRHDQEYLHEYFADYLQEERFTLICTPVKYGIFSQQPRNEKGEPTDEYLFSLFEGTKFIGITVKKQSSKIAKKCLKYRKNEEEDEKPKQKQKTYDDKEEDSSDSKKSRKAKDKTKEDNADDSEQEDVKKKSSVSDWFSQNVL